MKEFITKHKWLIGLSLSIIILLGIIVYFGYTNRLNYFFTLQWKLLFDGLANFEKVALSSSLIAVIALGTFINWFSKLLYDLIFPNTTKKILEHTVGISCKQDELISKVSGVDSKIDELLKKTNIDPRDISQYLNELQITNDDELTKDKINSWFSNKRISSDEKEMLLVISTAIFEHKKVLQQEIDNLKTQSEVETAGYLEDIRKYLTQGKADKIKDAYFSVKEKLSQKKILILEQSIKATEVLFAINESNELYKELIILNPSAINYFKYAYFLHRINYFNEAEKYYAKAIEGFRQLALENPKKYLPEVAGTLNNIAALQVDKNELSKGQENYEKALSIFKKYNREYPKLYKSDIARIYNNLALLDKKRNMLSSAQEKFDKAYFIFIHLDHENPKTYRSDIARILNNSANLHAFNKETKKAFEKYEKSLKIYKELANENPKLYLTMVARSLNNLANLHSEVKEHSQAQEIYEEALTIYIELAKENPKVHMYDIAMILNNLGILLKNKNELTQAQEKLEEALKIYRELAQEDRKAYLRDVAMALCNLSNIYLRIDELPTALERHEESLKLWEELAKENPSSFDIEYARILVMGVDLFNKDKGDLEKAKMLLEKFPNVVDAQLLLKLLKHLEQ